LEKDVELAASAFLSVIHDAFGATADDLTTEEEKKQDLAIEVW